MDNPLISSTEELSPEDRLLLTCTKRQEPQGEEHKADQVMDAQGKDSSGGYIGLTRTKKKLPSSPSSSDTESDSDLEGDEERDHDYDLKQEHYYSASGGGICSNSNSISSRGSLHRNSGAHPCNLSLDSSHSTYNTLIIHQNNNSLLADTWIPASHEFTSVGMGQRNSGCSASRKSQSPARDLSSSLSTAGGGSDGLHSDRRGDSAVTSTELLEIPRDYWDQLTVLKHLAKEVQQDPISSSVHPNLLRSSSFSRSQPDLTHATIMSTNPHSCSHDFDYYDCSKPSSQSCQQPPQKFDSAAATMTGTQGTEKGEDVLPSVQILEILMRENSNLKAELANARRRIQTIHKLEAELTRLQKEHASLFESAERRESLERTARAKLTTEVKRLTAVNRELLSSSNSLQNISPYAISSDADAYKKEIAKRDSTISQLISENKELTAAKERQEVELAAQRATLAEQRTHIDILDSALTNAQQNVLRLEEECHKKQEYVEKVSQLQRALSSLQVSNEKREQSEKKLRSQLESEITDLKLQLASVNANSNTHVTSRTPCGGPPAPRNYTAPPPYPGTGSNSNSNSTSNLNQCQEQKQDLAPELQLLQEKLKLSEEKIHSLQSVVARWEQFFTLEGQNNHNLSQPGSTPNTPSSWSSRGETPHFFGGNGSGSASSSGAVLEDLSSTHNRAADLERTVKDLESRLIERDAMIRVLHLQNQPPPMSLPSNLYSSFNSNTSSSYIAPVYRESPCYSSSMSGMKSEEVKGRINHQPSMSLASAMGNMGKSLGVHLDPALFYSKVTKCDSEPPSYANLPSKLRLGGSGSSLAKNSNESLGSVGQASNASSSHKNSSPGSVDSSRSNTKSIDEQLKELDNQLLSKEVSGLKMQSGLCCIPGFSHPSTAARKGKIPQSLLESISQGTMMSSSSSNNNSGQQQQQQHKKTSILPPLPKPPTSHNNSTQNGSRTSSGPPFMSPSVGCSGGGGPSSDEHHEGHSVSGLPLSNSVDSILADANGNKANVRVSGGNVFTPVSALPKGLPPKSPGLQESSKCKSLERDQKGKLVADYGAGGKYTQLPSDSSRCKSLDRREVKQQKAEDKLAKEKEKAEKEKEKKAQKSSVSSKAAFFGGLLTRRSPSPCRQKEKERESSESKVPIMQGRSVRFPFGKGNNGSNSSPSPSESMTMSHHHPQQDHHQMGTSASGSDADPDTAFLDMQGRSSQRNRISKWSLSSSNLCSPQEQTKISSGCDSPWNQRRSGGDPISTRHGSGGSMSSCPSPTPQGEDKKWGKIVKTPFGLRYTFGSPTNSSSGSK